MSKKIINADALEWLRENRAPAIFTSPPDADEIGRTPAEWEDWFKMALTMCLAASDGPVAFYVTDRKGDGKTYSKASLIFQIIAEAKASLTWHKIVLRRDVGKVDIHRPGFTHLIAINGKPGTATADTIRRGNVLYPNGTGLIAARVAVEWMKAQGVQQIVDPFCGRGTIPAVAHAMGLEGVGIDLDPAQCTAAEALRLEAATAPAPAPATAPPTPATATGITPPKGRKRGS